ncbi:DNA ligase D [Geomonas sp. Red69]|uniref:DNA ligase D n=1 Tax=Geomonas diazotrophica TaxID=2843197 RepID=UPI001C120346|nr:MULTISPECIES: DNA ligase D [Geomonas]MBU5635450.1 DNA ligase D [Geomonas diazotrophica]QXE86637.1 DNA ligase D [Geomonas nitrogeniifigens]
MGLEEYRRKRDLNRTPEPAGKVERSVGTLRFVVHKHAASHLHYDFRLEINGVLKSWAIPKGPSLDPSVKRLAMMVEDHPYEYGDFEGVIPKGNYGAGEVIIWDAGTFHAAATKEPELSLQLLREGLQKGDLKFVLHGEKLNGEFALVRIKGDKGNSWLLIKKKDQFAGTEDVTLQERSVVSNATIEDVRAGRMPRRPAAQVQDEPAGTDSPASPHPPSPSSPGSPGSPGSAGSASSTVRGGAPMPHQLPPMLATSAAESFNDPDWLFEIKLDGYRALAEVSGSEVALYSRNNLSFNKKFSTVVTALASLGVEAVLDGEVVALDDSGRSSFQLLQNYRRTGRGNIAYFVFDLLYLNGVDLRNQPLLARKERLRALLPDLPDLPDIRYSDHVMEYGRQFFELVRQNNLEGLLAKRATSTYQAGRRSKDWLKIKVRLQQEAVICGFTQPRRSRKGFGALVLGVFEEDRLVCIGFAGGGFDEAGLMEMYHLLQPLAQEKSPFQQPVASDMPITWVRPELVCEVEFSEWTAENVMRHPIYLGLREDKDPKSVVREMVVSPPVTPQPAAASEPPSLPRQADRKKGVSGKKGAEELLILGGHRLELSNLDKVFWPDQGYTKGDVISYYRAMAHAMLPHLVDRPESLYRTPNGITMPGFFQKEAGELPPSWITTREIYSKHVDKNIKFFVCQDEATLVYMANLGCIEINPWLSRLQHLDYPDYFVIDLDPEDIPFAKVIETALAVREVLDLAGAIGFPKTSGATGIHIYVPLGAKYDYDAAGEFARVIATLVHYKVPDFTSILRSPKLRQKKVYLDFLQNKPGQTLAAPYSIRPRPGATVSAPLRWEEVKPGLDPGQFTIATMPRRLEHMGDLFAGVLGPGIDLEQCIENLERR